VALTINENTRLFADFTCGCCGATAKRTAAYVDDGDTRVGWYLASCYHHRGVHEAYIDAILGTWGTDNADDHLTFTCRVGPVENSHMPACTLVDAETPPDQPQWGRPLSREEGLAHAWLGDYWDIVDAILDNDLFVNHHVYGHLQHTDTGQQT
jgi:hypothetical protein